ncbi:hypothetical protein Pcinc_003776 [Petrolisthes cinctipes]|uniref:Uncharacterized protein n=1 Tax=Petrolisthes cinctipes TaxID=88211 RepID=A0AAE1GMW2_PETCI|nr:hypothetical protein Pcinc_003776 [Petrolisthes cinctipes]
MCGTVSQPCPIDFDLDDNSTEAMEMCLVVWGPITLSVLKKRGGEGKRVVRQNRFGALPDRCGPKSVALCLPVLL